MPVQPGMIRGSYNKRRGREEDVQLIEDNLEYAHLTLGQRVVIFYEITGERIHKSTYNSIANRLRNAATVLPQGRPSHLSADEDAELGNRVRAMGQAGGMITSAIISSCAHALLSENPVRRQDLAEFGGETRFSSAWANTWARRQNLVMRAPSTQARITPNHVRLAEEFRAEIKEEVERLSVDPQLVLNMDQTGVRVIPHGGRTRAQRGAQRVTLLHSADKRQITAQLTIAASGTLLPPQIIYQGTDGGDGALPSQERRDLADGWCFTQTGTHWATHASLMQWATDILLPYILNVRTQIENPNAPVILILDKFAPHRDDSLLTHLTSLGNTYIRFVPGGCTSLVQPADLGLNRVFKAALRREFASWLSKQMVRWTAGGNTLETFRLSVGWGRIKGPHLSWMKAALSAVTPQHVRKCWEKSLLAGTPAPIVIDDATPAPSMPAPIIDVDLDDENEEDEDAPVAVLDLNLDDVVVPPEDDDVDPADDVSADDIAPTPRTRRCGLCRQTGHNKRTCPNWQ